MGVYRGKLLIQGLAIYITRRHCFIKRKRGREREREREREKRERGNAVV